MQRSVPAVVLTFFPHPRTRSLPEEGGLLLSQEERTRLIRGMGVDWVAVLGFARAVREMPAERFFREVLLAMLGARVVIVGPNHRFGAGGAGNEDLLRQLGASTGVAVAVAPEVRIGDVVVSSRRIRAWLAAGDVVEAARSLGRPYRLSGRVVRGAGIGRDLGFPTANIEVDPDRVVPARGVYGCIAHLPDGAFPAVANIGSAPTVRGPDEQTRRIEVHVVDRDPALYGKEIGISFIVRVREERRFGSVADLRRQIALDVGRVRDVIRDDAETGLGITAGNSDPSPPR